MELVPPAESPPAWRSELLTAPCHPGLRARWSQCYTASMDPNDLPHAKLLYALARHVFAGREHTYQERSPGGGVEVAEGRIRFIVEVDSVEF